MKTNASQPLTDDEVEVIAESLGRTVTIRRSDPPPD